jgi:hypothetical protein
VTGEHSGLPPHTPSRRRTLAGCALVFALALPGLDSWRSAQLHMHLWLRLHNEHKVPPDLVRDREYRQLLAYLPVGGTVGLMHTGSGTAIDRARTHYWLQYSLAPRLLVESTDRSFVIVSGSPSTGSPLREDPAFELMRSFGDELSVYRRVIR